jgi:hypothetical protein
VIETGEFRPFLGRVDETWYGARTWSVLVFAIGLPFCLIVFGMAWANGAFDYQSLVWTLVGLAIVSAGGYIVIAMLAAMIRTSLTLTGEGLVYETTRRGPDGSRTTLRIESPWSGVRAIREPSIGSDGVRTAWKLPQTMARLRSELRRPFTNS